MKETRENSIANQLLETITINNRQYILHMIVC